MFSLSVTARAENSASSIQIYASVNEDGLADVTMTVRLRITDKVESMYFPLPLTATDIKLNDNNVNSTRGATAIEVRLDKSITEVVGDHVLTFEFKIPDVVNMVEGKLTLDLPLLSGFSYPISSVSLTVMLPENVETTPVFKSTYHQDSIDSVLSCSVSNNIITGSEVYHGRIQDKFGPVIREKLMQYPCEIIGITICEDNLEGIVKAAEKHLEAGADFLIFTGGMSVDPDDLTPTAIRRLGAEIIRYGVPSQPGNMTLVAYLGDIPILGVPGAAIKLPTTVFDVLLPQVFAGEKISREELINLADGGLCQMCTVCHWPNCTFGRY